MGLPSCDKTADPPITKSDIRDVAARQEESQKDDRIFPIKINVFRDGDTLEIVTIDDSGGEKTVYYIFRANSGSANGRIFDSNEFSGNDSIPLEHSEALKLFEQWNDLLLNYFGEKELSEIEVDGAAIERKVMEGGEDHWNNTKLQNMLTAYYILVEIREYKRKFIE
jgi:hypothetical protein